MSEFKKGKIDNQWWIIKGTNRFCSCSDEKEADFTLEQLNKGEDGVVPGCDSNFYIISAIAANRDVKKPRE